MFLLAHLLPRHTADGTVRDSRLDQFDRTIADIRTGFPATLAALTDSDVEMVPIEYRDFHPVAPGDQEEEN